MKKSKLISKVKRYIMLSIEFEQDAHILFEDRAVDGSSMCITTTGTSFSVGGTGSFIINTTDNITTEVKTRADVILDKALEEANRSDRYDEYKKLQETLSKYVTFYIDELNK
tara:strand:- start:99 stop:434 length:336 start_codon:yes stop_codon:yes gene_type:complete